MESKSVPYISFRKVALPVMFLVAGAASVESWNPFVPAARAEEATPVSEADVTYFYQHPSPAGVARLMPYFNGLSHSDKPFADPPTIGFLAAALQRYPDDIDEMIPAGLSPRMLGIVAVSLRLAGQGAKAQSIVDHLKASGASAPDLERIPSSLEAVPAAGPSEFDMLWGASFATGDPRYCSKILARYAAVANVDGNAEDILAIVKTIGARPPADLHWVAAKHGAEKARELATISSALWALDSNAHQHEFVRVAVDDYVRAHPTEPASKALVTLAQEYGHYDLRRLISVAQPTPGKFSATIDVALLSRVLDDLGRHAAAYPPHFESTDERQRAERDVVTISKGLDLVSANFSQDPAMLLRLARLHAMGHNLDIPGSAEKAIATFTTLLKLVPDDPQANYQYGAFLAATTRSGDAIPFLEKAKRLGVVNSDYWLGMTYQLTGDKAKAVENLESYTKRVPGDENAARILDAVRNDKVEIKVLKPNS